MLNAGVVDQQVDAAEFRQGLAHHRFDGFGPAHVGAVVAHLHVVKLGEFVLQPVDGAGLTETVEDDVRALRSQAARDAQTDARGRAGDEGGFADEHDEVLLGLRMVDRGGGRLLSERRVDICIQPTTARSQR